MDKLYCMKNLFFLLLSIFCIPFASAQVDSIAPEPSPIMLMEESLQELAETIMKDSVTEKRVNACQSFIPLLVEALKNPNSFLHPFDSLKTISIQYPADSSFRIFTWQLYVDVADYRYFGALQMNSEELKLYPLKDESANVDDAEYDILSPEEWYGAVYYNLKDFETPDGTQYLLFGYDGYQFFDKRKIVDVLRFRDGEPVFGSPVFAKIEEGRNPITQNRLVREYSAASSIRCNYDIEHSILLLDHMTTTRRLDGNGLSQIPDGTYEGYRLKDGLWVYEEKVFHEMLDEAPRPKPVLDSRKKKDIFGN